MANTEETARAAADRSTGTGRSTGSGRSTGGGRGAALPLYLRISERLTREIAAGLWADGARLPPERDFAAALGASVGTLRKALAELERRGLLVRRQGSGNYIRSPGPETSPPPSVYALFRLERLGGGGLPTAETLSVARRSKPAGAPRFGASPTAHRIRRLRSLDGRPAALEEIWLDASCADVIEAGALPEALYLYYAEALGLEIADVEDRVSVAPAPDWAPRRFGAPTGSICGYVERIGAAKGGAAVEYSRTWVDASVAVYVARLREETRWRG